MGKCKNVECSNETEGKRVYCSMKCRNYYVNKYLRDYSKNSEGLSKDTKEKYKSNPKFCVNVECGKELTYDKRLNTYCSSSCSAKVTNLGREHSDETKVKIHKARMLNVGTLMTVECKNCGESVLLMDRKVYCSGTCKQQYRDKNIDSFTIYKQETAFNFSLNNYPDEFDFKLIEEHGWYKPSNRGDNLGGVSRDHMLSVRDGYDKGVDPKLLSHPANCELMIHNDNVSKNKKSSITEEELKDKIKEWDKKYKCYGKY